MTYHNNRHHKHHIHKETPHFGKPGRVSFEPTTICEEKVRVHQNSKLGSCNEKRSNHSPDLRVFRRHLQNESLNISHVVKWNHFRVYEDRGDERRCYECPGDQL
jgi:hypothetical protein